MIDLCISGSLVKDIITFSLGGETKTIDQFSDSIHFSLKEKQMYRIRFEQKTEQYIPHGAEIVLNILFLPIRGVFNIITFNVDQNWESDISAFKISGYIDVNLNEDTEVSFQLKQGEFDKVTNCFCKPKISFSPNVLIEQTITSVPKEISKKHGAHLQNIASVSVWLFALLFYLLFVALDNSMYIAIVFTSSFMIAFIILVGFLVLRSFKIKNNLVITLLTQQHKEHS